MYLFVFLYFLHIFHCVWTLAEISLDALMKHYAGAYAEGFEWPQTGLQSGDDDDMDDSEGGCDKPNCGLTPVLITE